MTRLEVATAFVVATVVVIAASLIFKVVERNAGNARAMSKLLAFRQVVEEYASEGLGYPDVEAARGLWSRHRVRDYLLSPWGGHVGSDLDQATGSRGVEAVPFFDIPARRDGGRSKAGGIAYMLAPNAQATAKLLDVSNGSVVVARFYGAFLYDPDGVFPHYPIGGR